MRACVCVPEDAINISEQQCFRSVNDPKLRLAERLLGFVSILNPLLLFVWSDATRAQKFAVWLLGTHQKTLFQTFNFSRSHPNYPRGVETFPRRQTSPESRRWVCFIFAPSARH